MARSKEKLGPDHPDTLRVMNNLGTTYSKAGNSAKAIPLLEETWAKRKEKLGPDHPDTLRVMNNLATAYLNAGNPAKALPLFLDASRLQRTPPATTRAGAVPK